MSHTYSTPTTATYAVTFDTLDQMMAAIPDNNDNLISARDVRDSLLTLWWQTQDLGASFSATASQFFYSNPNPSTIAVGGIPVGTTFSNRTLQQMFDDMFYPYTAPSCSLSATNPSREFGSPNSTTLSWSVTRAKLTIQTITVDGQSFIPNGGNQTGTKSAIVTQDVNTTFSMSVSDGTSTINASTSVNWFNAVYWGTTNAPTLPNMTITSPQTQPTWATGAGVGSGKTLASGRSGTYNGINGAGNYLVFAWPTAFGEPTFTANGLSTTAWFYYSNNTYSNYPGKKLGSSVSFANMFGYTTNYDVWISDTAQNSPISTFSIS